MPLTEQEIKELKNLAKDVQMYIEGKTDDKKDASFSIKRIQKILSQMER